MQDQRHLLGRLRAILRDAVPIDPRNEKIIDPTVAPSHLRRARVRGEILDLAARYGWHREVERAVARQGVPSLKYLGGDQLDQVLERLHVLEQCLQTPCDPPDSPPAR